MIVIDSTTLHTTYLHPLTGEGLILVPPACDDLQLDAGGHSLHSSSEAASLARLDALGWGLSDDEDGEPAWVHVGWTEDGREASGLYGRHPVTTTSTLEVQAKALAELCEAAGVTLTVPTQRWSQGAEGDCAV